MTCMGSFQFGGGYGHGSGEWIFEESKKGFTVQRLADGFALTIVANIKVNSDTPAPVYIDQLRVDIAEGMSPQSLRLGTAFDRKGYSLQPGRDTPVYLVWQGSIAALETFERQREGREPQFVFDCGANIELLNTFQITTPGKPATTRNITVRTTPMSIWCQVRLAFPKDAWVAALNGAGLRKNVLIEIPLPHSRSDPWDAVWQATDEARRHFEQGGTTGWNGCATAVRKALDAWQQISGEKVEWDSAKPSRETLKAQSKTDRFNGLRWQLLQCAHLAPHSPDNEWTRDDAVLMLATLSGLLAIRNL